MFRERVRPPRLSSLFVLQVPVNLVYLPPYSISMSWAASWDLRVFDRGTESYTRFGKLRIEYGWIAVSLFIDMLPSDSCPRPCGPTTPMPIASPCRAVIL